MNYLKFLPAVKVTLLPAYKEYDLECPLLQGHFSLAPHHEN